MSKGKRVASALGVTLFLSGCAGPLLLDGGPCRVSQSPVPLPAQVPESSGVAPGWPQGAPDRPSPPLYWTHNDSGWEPELFGVAPDGTLQTSVRVAGAENVDWEDMAAGPCAFGRCLYVADTGDNLERREELILYRLPEPALGDTLAHPVHALSLRLPHGPRDVEALLLLPDEDFLLVSKGRSHPVEVYGPPEGWRDRWNWREVGEVTGRRDVTGGGDGGSPLPLKHRQTLTQRPPQLPQMVTGGAVTPDGRLAILRTYETLRFFQIDPTADEPLQPLAHGWVNLRPLREAQGEAVAFVPGNRLVLTSEAGPGQALGQMTLLECDLQGWSW